MKWYAVKNNMFTICRDKMKLRKQQKADEEAEKIRFVVFCFFPIFNEVLWETIKQALSVQAYKVFFPAFHLVILQP